MINTTYKTAVICILGLFLSSCLQEKEDQNTVRTFLIDNFQESVLDVTEIVADMKLLPLKLDSGQVIGQIKDICFIGDTAYILDAITASIFSFDMKDGKCISTTCKRGNGPNEYLNPVALSTHSNKLYVLDMPTSRIIEFDKDLNAISDLKFEFPASDFISVDTGFLLYNLAPTDDLKKFVHINKKGQSLNSFVPADKDHSSEGYVGGLGKYFLRNEIGNVFVSESYSNHIYMWEQDSLTTAFQINYKGLNIPSDLDKNKINLLEDSYAFTGNVFIMSDLFIPSFFFKSKRYYGFLPMQSGDQKTGIVKDNQQDVPFFPQWQNERQLIGTCCYESVEKYFSEKNKNFDAEHFEPENPVLVLYSFDAI